MYLHKRKIYQTLTYFSVQTIDFSIISLVIYFNCINFARDYSTLPIIIWALLKQDLGDARQTSETIHQAVAEFVGDAEPSDDLTKLCIKMR